MHNFFILDQASATAQQTIKRTTGRDVILDLTNRLLKIFRVKYHVVPSLNPVVDMTTVEQRINFFHLLDAVIANHVRGDVVELGCFTGQCALLFQQVIAMHQSAKTLHLYDSFEVKFSVKTSVEEVLSKKFQQAHLPLPVLHKGYFEKTVPAELPDEISFAHLDCGFGGAPLLHKQVVLHCLQSVYSRMSSGAVCVLMDYYTQAVGTVEYGSENPGVQLACDEFLADKPEKIVALYGNQYAHGFFRKL